MLEQRLPAAGEVLVLCFFFELFCLVGLAQQVVVVLCR